jgi:hypothetical protein
MTEKHRRFVPLVSVLVGLTALIHCIPANAQDTAVVGTVASSTKNTLTVNTGSGQFQLYTFTTNAVKPDTLPVGTQVQVISSPGNESDVRIAREVTVIQRGAPAPPPITDSMPADVRRLERDIERELRRYQFSGRAGVALDPELVVIGADMRIGPILRSGLYFRPGIELGIGEVTTMIGFNGEMIYRLPFTGRSDRWSTYVGAGVGVNLLSQGFEGEEDGSRFNFDDFKSDTAMNLVGGVRRRNGVFLELRTSVYSRPSPTLRLMVGYTF